MPVQIEEIQSVVNVAPEDSRESDVSLDAAKMAQLAEVVFRLIKQELVIERERQVRVFRAG